MTPTKLDEVAEKCLMELIRQFGGLSEWPNSQKQLVRDVIKSTILSATEELRKDNERLNQQLLGWEAQASVELPLRQQLTEAQKQIAMDTENITRMQEAGLRMEGQLEAAQKDRERLLSAAKNLSGKMKAIHNDPLYLAVWQSALSHGVNYSQGPTYEHELKALNKAILSATHPNQPTPTSEERKEG